MIEDVLPDGRRCRLSSSPQPTTAARLPADTAARRVIVRCEIDGLAPMDVPLDATWADTMRLPPGLAELIIRHFLLV